jgi:hypothetical protein
MGHVHARAIRICFIREGPFLVSESILSLTRTEQTINRFLMF